MTSTAETASLQRELQIGASPETVWEFLVDPEKAKRWMGLSVTIDAQPGGAYRCEVIPGHVALGEVTEVNPPRRLVCTWGWEPGEDGPATVPPGSSTVEIELVREGAGTRLLFTHRDLPHEEAAQKHTVGWDHYLARLTVVAGGGDPGADPWLEG
jgi:uncharacterized protein YndB with AHSA1/START domain